MVRFVTALFLVLHGLVHLLYAGQSRRVSYAHDCIKNTMTAFWACKRFSD